MNDTEIRRLFVLLCGYEILPKAISVRGATAQFILSEPVCAYLLDTASGWVLLDAGMNPDNIDMPERREAYFTRHGMTPPIVRQPHRMEVQLAEIGVDFGDIGRVILSHLHFDHCGYLDRLSHALISVQRREYEQAMREDAGPAYIRRDFDNPAITWDFQDGDWSPMPGLTLLDTRGHTEGHQSALVRLPGSGAILLPFDAGDLTENFTQEIPPGESIDDAAALAAIQRLKRIEADLDATMLLFHDPAQIQTMRLAPDYYD